NDRQGRSRNDHHDGRVGPDYPHHEAQGDDHHHANGGGPGQGQPGDYDDGEGGGHDHLVEARYHQHNRRQRDDHHHLGWALVHPDRPNGIGRLTSAVWPRTPLPPFALWTRRSPTSSPASSPGRTRPSS